MAKQQSGSEDLIDEAHSNLNEDRTRIKGFAEQLNKLMTSEGEKDPISPAALVEPFARLTGELNKNNALLVELAKIRMKKEIFKNAVKNGFSEEETDSMFDAIDSSEGEEGSN